MKKYLVLLLTILMCGSLASTAFAGTIPIEVSSGNSIRFSGQSSAGNDLSAAFCFNFIDRIAISLQYTTPSSYYTLSTRYSFWDNIAVSFSYSNSNPITWNVDFRMKYDCDESLALVGLLAYDGVNPGLTGQIEYRFHDQFAGNLGLKYQNTERSLIVGCEFVIDKIDIGLDCYFTDNNFYSAQAALFVQYTF
jgi:hypothetical protein